MDYKKECNRLIDKILKKGEIKRKDLMIALALRLNIPIETCDIRNFDVNTLKNAVEMLKIML